MEPPNDELSGAMMMLLAALALAAPAPAQCTPVQLVLFDKMPAAFRGKPFRETSANFLKAHAQACSEGLLKKRPLAAGHRLMLTNAPDSNVASIYTSKGKSLLEFSFVDHVGKVHVPTTAELHEAIFCALQGASAAEQEESGRCLPD